MFSSIWNETSVSGNRRSRACPTDTPRNAAISRASSGCALPEKTFSSPNPVALKGSPITSLLRIHSRRSGWGGRIRTFEYGIQSPAPYRLATPHHAVRDARLSSAVADSEKADLRSGRDHVAQTVSLYDGLFTPQAAGACRAAASWQVYPGRPRSQRGRARARERGARQRPGATGCGRSGEAIRAAAAAAARDAEQAEHGRAAAGHRRMRRPRPGSGARRALQIAGCLARYRTLEVVADVRRDRSGPGRPPSRFGPVRAASSRSHHAYASRVLTPNAGNDQHDRHRAARSASGKRRSPRPRPSAVPPLRKNGTSAPSAAAIAPSARLGPHTPQHGERAKRRGRIAAAAAEARLHGNPLPDARHARRRASPRRPAACHNACAARHTRFVSSVRTRGIIARESGTVRGRACRRERVVQRDRLEDGPQLVVAVGSRRRGPAG